MVMWGRRKATHIKRPSVVRNSVKKTEKGFASPVFMTYQSQSVCKAFEALLILQAPSDNGA